MKCPFCKNLEDRVVDSRASGDGLSIRRRRECLDCGRRFTTYERIEQVPVLVVKKDGSREPFNRRKVMDGLLKACEKRPVSIERLEEVCDGIENSFAGREVMAKELGQQVMNELRELDQVAYVRFASVYREFKDPSEFMDELRSILVSRQGGAKAKKKKKKSRKTRK